LAIASSLADDGTIGTAAFYDGQIVTHKRRTNALPTGPNRLVSLLKKGTGTTR
jgi:hypothetical protein